MIDQTISTAILTLALAQDGPHVPGGPAATAQPVAGASPGAAPAQPTSTGAPAGSAPAGMPASSGPFGGFTFLPVLVILVVMILITSMSGRKEKKRRAAILAGVGKNDRVQTVGGIIGTVVELTETEMVLRVDEAANTRVRFARSALQQVLRSSRDKSATTDVEVKPALTTRV
ncbi:MAG: preprotein translocase subunit YajC [Phycisphaerales bacterium]|nr:preprotein translocase subunit YajC [Phycisphaerales bacterium]